MGRAFKALATTTVALMVVLVASACGGDSDSGTDAPADGVVSVIGTDALAFEPSQLTVPAGEVTIELTSEPSAPHTFTIEELGDREVVRASGGETATGTVTLDAGTYTFYCSIPGHRQAGMEGTLTVE
jgi:plastocyanin